MPLEIIYFLNSKFTFVLKYGARYKSSSPHPSRMELPKHLWGQRGHNSKTATNKMCTMLQQQQINFNAVSWLVSLHKTVKRKSLNDKAAHRILANVKNARLNFQMTETPSVGWQ